jgi:putative pyruvate formate lyase activating enzyme
MGRLTTASEFAEICLGLQKLGAENINLVTGSHFVPSIAEGLELSRDLGLKIPALWNSSGYDSLSSLERLSDLVDVWLPDLKTLDVELARTYSKAVDYPEVAKAAIEWMVAHAPLRVDDGRMRSGVIVRHLVLPGKLDGTRAVIAWFAERLKGRALLSLMTQYTPIVSAMSPEAPDRYVSSEEYEALMAMLEEFEIDDGFYQELEMGSDWLPDFERANPFSSSLSKSLWHWKEGFLR